MQIKHLDLFDGNISLNADITRNGRIQTTLNLPRRYNFKVFQHTAAVVAIQNGANIKEFPHQKGHSSVAITDEYLKNMVGYESEFFRKEMPDL